MGQQSEYALIRRIKALREQVGWTQEAVAQMLQVAQATYNRWENEVRMPKMKQSVNLLIELEKHLQKVKEEQNGK